MKSIFFTWFPISGLGLPNIYQNLMLITMCVGFFDLGVYLVSVIILFLVMVW
ncbi:uncharacterized protein METZ01_LOCUS274103 [marine metagenome]|uniref:Uncharacterized protein n=1 Tax=marine metagenome TaxID=408172 RepID=A0A382KAP0_9ZZZZ